MSKDWAQEPLTISDFAVVMNAVIIEVYAQLATQDVDEKLTDLANRFHKIAAKATIPSRRVIMGALADSLMGTEDGGL